MTFCNKMEIAICKKKNTTDRSHADSQVINYSTSAEMESYKKVKEKVGLKSNELVDYMWYDFLAGGGFGATGNLTDTTILVGIEPSTYG